MYYPCSENKGADQLRGYREADLRLCFRLCKLLVFSCTGSILKDLSIAAKMSGFRCQFCEGSLMEVDYPKLYNMAHLLALNVLLLPKDLTIIFDYFETDWPIEAILRNIY